MDLLQEVAANLKVEEGKAEKGIGAMLMALRMALPKDTFEQVKKAIPNSERMMGHALMSGSPTGEPGGAPRPPRPLPPLPAPRLHQRDGARLRPAGLGHV